MRSYFVLWMLIAFSSCVAGRKAYNPDKKFSPAQLQRDFDLYRKVLEERHPSLYWYTSKVAMDSIFEVARRQLADSMTETAFRKVLMVTTAAIQCGHTSVKASKKGLKYFDTLQTKPQFPVSLKIWSDTAVLTKNTFQSEKKLSRGDRVEAVNGISMLHLLDTFYHYIPADGGNQVAKNQWLSSGNRFGLLFNTVYGTQKEFTIQYTDTSGVTNRTLLTPVVIKKDSMAQHKKKPQPKPEKKSKAARLMEMRSLRIDSTGTTAVMELNSFAKGLRLTSFFRNSFRELRKKEVTHLIIDLRLNGGGRVVSSTLLTKYLAEKNFKLADSLYARTRTSRYSRYIKGDFWMKLIVKLNTRKKAPEQYHYVFFEKHYFKPKRKHHFGGQVYILSGGLTYSASTLVMQVLRPQPNITLVGEPSGGAAYGNTAWLIPDVTLPQTKVRFRLPLFRLVIDKSQPKDGQGVLPEIWATPSAQAIKNGEDYKMQRVRRILSEN